MSRPDPASDRERRIDRLVPWGVAGLTFASLATLSLLHHYTLLDGYDMGYFRQAAWLINHGHPVFITSRGLYLLGDHASPIVWPVAWMTAPFPPTGSLLVLQSAALALGVVPLYAIGRRLAGLAVVPATIIVLAYAAYPALHNVNLFDFHPEVAAVPALLGATLFGLTRRWVAYAACVVVALLCKEDFAIVVASLGGLLALEGHRRAGLVTAAAGLVVLVFDLRVVQPHFAGGFVQAAFLDRYGQGLGEITKTMVLHPFRVLGDLLTRQNLEFVIAILAPVLFLPVFAPKYLLPAVPMQLLYLVSSRGAAHTIHAQYTVAIMGFVFVAAAMAVGRARADGTRLERTVLGALLVAAFLFNAAQSDGGLGASPWAWRHRDAVDRARLAGARVIPKSAAVSATDRLRPLIAGRRNLYNFQAPFDDYQPHNDPVPIAVRQRQTRYLFIDTTDGVQWPEDRRRALERFVPELGFQKIFDRAGILVFRR